MQVVILLAGQGKRMGDLTKNTHKSLLTFDNGESFLSRLLHQLNEFVFSKVIIVTGYKSDQIINEIKQYQLNFEVIHNEKYKDDTNIYSMQLALEKVNKDEPVIIIEGDIWLEDAVLKSIYDNSLSNNSIWFTRGNFNSNQYGGILLANKNDNVIDIKIVPKYGDIYKNYKKLSGIMTIGTDEITLYQKLINTSYKKSTKQYYLEPWINHLDKLPSKNVDFESNKIVSLNTKNEFDDFNTYLKSSNNKNVKIELIDINKLKPIEDYIKERADNLYNKIITEQEWIKPIIVDKTNFLVLDGHHRFEVAKK